MWWICHVCLSATMILIYSTKHLWNCGKKYCNSAFLSWNLFEFFKLRAAILHWESILFCLVQLTFRGLMVIYMITLKWSKYVHIHSINMSTQKFSVSLHSISQWWINYEMVKTYETEHLKVHNSYAKDCCCLPINNIICKAAVSLVMNWSVHVLHSLKLFVYQFPSKWQYFIML